MNSGKAVSPGKGRRGIPCRESVPPFLQGFSVHPVRTLKRATGRFRPTNESLKAAYRTSPQLCQERTFAIEEREPWYMCGGAWRGASRCEREIPDRKLSFLFSSNVLERPERCAWTVSLSFFSCPGRAACFRSLYRRRIQRTFRQGIGARHSCARACRSALRRFDLHDIP